MQIERFDLGKKKRRRRHRNGRAESKGVSETRSEECSREGREEFLTDSLKKPSINEAVDSERRV